MLTKLFLRFIFLTIQLIVMICSAQVGINTTNPHALLDINGTLRLEHSSQGEGKVLQVSEYGYAKWENISYFNLIMGDLHTDGIEVLSLNDTKTYLKGSITLPPGNFLVSTILILSPNSGSDNLYSYKSASFTSVYFSDSDTNPDQSLDYSPDSAKLIGGKLVGPSRFGLIDGSVMLNNTSSSSKTYYLWAFKQSNKSTNEINDSTLDLSYLGSKDKWGENTLYAIPITLEN